LEEGRPKTAGIDKEKHIGRRNGGVLQMRNFHFGKRGKAKKRGFFLQRKLPERKLIFKITQGGKKK
jgi:hypothetical protein